MSLELEEVSVQEAFGLKDDVVVPGPIQVVRRIPQRVAEANPLIPRVGGFYLSPEKIGEMLLHHEMREVVHAVGPAGCGKTDAYTHFCGCLRLPLISVEANSEMTMEDLMGRDTLRDGQVVRLEGPALLARRLGAVLVINEFDALRGHVQLGLNGFLETGKAFTWAPKGAEVDTSALGKTVREMKEWVYPANERHRIVLTSNTGGKVERDSLYLNTSKTNLSTRDRQVYTYWDYAPEDVEMEILRSRVLRDAKVDPLYAETIRFANALRKLYKQNKAASTISVRGLIRWARYAIRTKSLDGAFMMTIYGSLEESDRQTALSIYKTDLGRTLKVPLHLQPQG